MRYDCASESVWAVVSGLPTGLRKRRLLVVLQAFIDDSGSEPNSPVFVLAGYIATTEAWARFADDWAAEMAGDDEFPTIKYFKMDEAMGLRDQFSPGSGWTRDLRDKKLVRLTSIIARTSRWQVCASMGQRDFEETLHRLPVFDDGRTLANDHPYTFLWYQLVSEMWLRKRDMEMDGPCDFIFDQRIGFEDEAIRYWKRMKEIMQIGDPELAKWMPNPPIFRDELEFKPLQAADLHAWTIRRLLANGSGGLGRLPLEALGHLADLKSVAIWSAP